YIQGFGDIPAQNCLRFCMTDGSWFACRPSGTEPKIKFYYYAVSDSAEVSADRVSRLQDAVKAVTDAVK
ncbi:MAG: phospho-sugar mutase, partial [Lachnospiraceae bacterium]|nr:phospho-sugar mutase [Lachnospiraceae bacterium]